MTEQDMQNNSYYKSEVSKNEGVTNSTNFTQDIKEGESLKVVKKENKNKIGNGGKALKSTYRSVVVLSLITFILSISLSFLGGYLGYNYANKNEEDTVVHTQNGDSSQIVKTEVVEEESAVIETSKKGVESVVSIVIKKDVQTSTDVQDDLFGYLFGEENEGETEKRQIGAGSGFIVRKDGYIITNKHVVADENAQYTVVLNDLTEISANVLARDAYLDIAILKVETERELKPVEFGNSDNVVVGQTVIAIGNSLGEFSNTVSKGIVSGLARTIVATDNAGNNPKTLENVIQTDASINFGNSGGPLMDIQGNVIGVNSAKASQGENIGFAIPINFVKPLLESVVETGEIVRPFLGVRYLDITPSVAEDYGLEVKQGALLVAEEDGLESAVVEGSPADKAGLQEGDIILEVNGEKIEKQKTLRYLVQQYSVDDTIKLKILRDATEIEVDVTLEKLNQ